CYGLCAMLFFFQEEDGIRDCELRLAGFIAGKRDVNLNLLQRNAIKDEPICRLTAGKVAAIDRVCIIRPGGTAGWKDKIDQRGGADRQAIEILLAAAVHRVEELERVRSLYGRRKIKHGILAQRVAHAGDLATVGIEENHRRMGARVEPFGRAVDDDPLALLKRELEIVVCVLIDAAANRRANCDFQWLFRRSFASPLRSLCS